MRWLSAWVFCVLVDGCLVSPPAARQFSPCDSISSQRTLTLVVLSLLDHSCLKQALQCATTEISSVLSLSDPFLSLLPEDLCTCFYCCICGSGPLFPQVSTRWLCLSIRLIPSKQPSILEWPQLFFSAALLWDLTESKPCPC